MKNERSSWKVVARLGFLVSGLLAVIFASGCASSSSLLRVVDSVKPQRHYVEDPTPATVLDLVAEDKNVQLSVKSVIVPDGPGSWFEGARWEEFVVAIENRSKATVRISGFALVDSRGTLIDSGFDMETLAARSDELAEEYKEAGLAALIGGISEPVKMAASVAVPLAVGLAPVAVVGGAGYILYRDVARRKDRRLVEEAFQSRLLPQGLSLAGGGIANDSVFFPVTAAPQKLVLSYSAGKELHELAIDLQQAATPAP